MDRREAMLRELNLYPLWTRRDAPAQADAIQSADTQDEVSPAAETVAHATVSLREFQLKIAGGPLAEIDWPELKQKVAACEFCTLRAGCSHTVFGTGDEHADWMFIGEAPGAEEDASGEPFMGHSGRLLDNMLLAIKLRRDQVYIANVIKCRPADDRHPHVGEIAACLPYLKRQIDLLKPKMIVALGRTAASALLETDATIASLRGVLHDYKGIPLLVTFHPAYLLRSPMEKAKVWQDLCIAVNSIEK